jgi:gamma-glutamyltranspeptidase/glutathione hydrolase
MPGDTRAGYIFKVGFVDRLMQFNHDRFSCRLVIGISLLFNVFSLGGVDVGVVDFREVGLADELIVTRPPRTSVKVARGNAGMVVSVSPLAAEVGRDILAEGGNAVDAAIGVGFALAVTWPEAGNIGGGGFMLVSLPEAMSKTGQSDDSDVVCIDFRETAPAAAGRRSFVDWKNRRHAKMAGVPGSVRGLQLAHQRFGSLAWRRLLEPAIKLAREGFEVDDQLAYSLNATLSNDLVRHDSRYQEFRRVFSSPTGALWRVGERLVQSDLATTLERIAAEGAGGFYQGPVADAIVREMRRGDGLIGREDLSKYRALIRPATRTQFRDYEVFGPPPPSSGGLIVGLQLKMLEQLELTSLEGRPWTARSVHLMCEVMKRSFRERAAWLGDPDFGDLKLESFSAASATRLAAAIDPARATPSEHLAGEIALSSGRYESEQTTHYSIVDASGMAVSTTTTLERSFGSWIVVRGAGFLLNNEMGDFNWYPGYTNRQGAIGTKPNQIAPGKRMLSSMSPTIVLQNNRPRLVVGSPGGRTIINTVTEVMVQHLAFERPLDRAVDAPRFHHQWFPDTVQLEGDAADLFAEVKQELVRRGHQVRQPDGRRQGSVQAIAIDPATGTATGVADWRRGGAAMAVVPTPDKTESQSSGRNKPQ